MTFVQTVASPNEAAGLSGQILGGGTLLMHQVNYKPQTVDTVIRVTDPALREVRTDQGDIRIGAGVTMAQVMRHPDLAELAPVARSIGGPALRNMATAGGNLFAPHPYGDFAVALLALEAKVVWADGREEDIETFLRNRDTARGMVTELRMPRLPSGALLYRKVSRTKPKGVSVMSIAVAKSTQGTRIAFGAMGPTPLRAKAAEAALGSLWNDASIAGACDACLNGLSPQDDALASAWYRSSVAPVHLRRCLTGEA